MRIRSRLPVAALCFAPLLVLAPPAHGDAASPRERLPFNADWRFV